jgi:hypothetical protein
MKSLSVKFILFFLFAIYASTASSQVAVLPSSWGFDTNAPDGWFESLGANNTRYASGQNGQACRLDATGDFVVLEFSEEPGILSYYLKGQNAGGPWQGTFTVEQSTDGVIYTPLRTLNGAQLPSTAFTLFSDQPNQQTRFIRWFYTEKMSGHNVAMDEVALVMPQAAPAQEINVVINNENTPSGSSVFIGNESALSITVQNLGLVNTLSISSIAISGQHASQFSTTNTPSSILAESGSEFTLNFNPIGLGSRFCTVTIVSNDSNESNYAINVYAVSGSLASEPVAQASEISFSSVVAWDFQTTISSSTSAENYIVLRRKGGPVVSAPQDGQHYPRGSWIGNAQVVYNGDVGSFDARGVEAGQTYYFAVFSFNGYTGFENYLTASPLTGSVVTPVPSFAAVYDGIDHNEESFLTELNAVLNPANYSQILYINYIGTLIDNFYKRDTVVDGVTKNMVECQYSGVPYIFDNTFSWSSLSREHVYTQSWMPTYFDSNFDQSIEVSDLHNIVPVWQNEVGAVRSNYPFGEVVNPTSVYQDCLRGSNDQGQTVYEMRANFKGDVARSIMYQATKYSSTSDDFSLPELISIIVLYGQDEYLLKQWHFQDLPDSWEITRNEYIASVQNNRNAFIDSVYFPCFIRFADMTPFKPEVIQDNATLVCKDNALSYQWYFNGVEIPGANDSVYYPQLLGDYSVEILQFNECPAFSSEAIMITCIGDDLNQTGCTDESACNFSANAVCDDGSCVFGGCTDPTSCNFDPNAFCDLGNCSYPGCTSADACNFSSSAGCDDGSCLYAELPCDDGNPWTLLDNVNANCLCSGTPFDYGAMPSVLATLCQSDTPPVFSLTQPLNLLSYNLQWYYKDGNVACPAGNDLLGWQIIEGANDLMYTSDLFTGTRTFACFVTPDVSYGLESNWASGCARITYDSFVAQAIIGNPNITPFTNYNYLVNAVSGHTYDWIVTGGAIASGQGTNSISVMWGQNGPYQLVLTESSGFCSDQSTLLLVNSDCSNTVTIFSENPAGFCPGTSNLLTAVSSNTVNTYNWYLNGTLILEQNTETIEITTGGQYQVEAISAVCSSVSQLLAVIELEGILMPDIQVSSTGSGCSGGEVTLSVADNTFSSYLWSNGATSPTIVVTESGEYSLTVSNAEGCLGTTGPLSINLSLADEIPICLVTVDPTTGNNQVIWEPTTSDVINRYAIYKESNAADVYVLEGTIDYGQDGIFNDANSNSAVQASRYKLAIIDTCDVESARSSLHKTIHLTSNLGLNGVVNLIWSSYEGFVFASYNIYRGTDVSNLELLATVASNLNSYTDLSPLGANAFYVVEVVGISCDPTRSEIPSRSNIVQQVPSAISEFKKKSIMAYPNPFSDQITIETGHSFLGQDFELTDSRGALVYSGSVTSRRIILQTANLPNGVYMLRVQSEVVRLVKI